MRKILIFLGLCVLVFLAVILLSGQPASSQGVPVLNVPFKSGHIGILGPLEARKKGNTEAKLRDFRPLEHLRIHGISVMEETAPWFWLEPEKGKLNWRVIDHDYEGVNAAGMKMGLSPMGNFVPDWVTREKDFQGFVCTEHNEETTFPSIFAPSTLDYYDRYYGLLSEHLEGKVSSIHPAGTSDYGEIGYPHGVKQWDDHHMHEGWWINDPYARASFSKYLESKFGTVAALNQHWGTRYTGFDSISYPKDSNNRRRWLDFMDWYRDSQTDFILELVELAKKHFPDIPIEIKLGQPNEMPIHGMDIAGLFKAGKEHGFMVRSTAAFVPTHVYKTISITKHPIAFFLLVRQATLAHFYDLPFVTEEFAGMSKKMSLPRLFNDATLGVDEVFAGPPTFMAALDYYRRFGAFIRGDYADTNIAFYYPLTDHLLKPKQAFPNGLFNAGNTLRERMNYGVLDDQMIDEGALDQYQYLVMFDLGVMKRDVLDAMDAWVRQGGVLVHPFAGEKLDVLEGKAGPAETSLFRFRNDSRTKFEGKNIYLNKLGKGAVVAIKKPSKVNQFYDVVVDVVYKADQLVPGVLTEPKIDLADDRVYASAFRDRVLLFNSGKRKVTKTFELSPKNFPILEQDKQFSVELSPLSLREIWLNESDANAQAALAANTTPAAGETEPEESTDPDDVRKRMEAKVTRFHKQMPIWFASGGDASIVSPKMEEFQRLLKAGKIAEAEAKLDKVLAIIEDKPKENKPE